MEGAVGVRLGKGVPPVREALAERGEAPACALCFVCRHALVEAQDHALIVFLLRIECHIPPSVKVS